MNLEKRMYGFPRILEQGKTNREKRKCSQQNKVQRACKAKSSANIDLNKNGKDEEPRPSSKHTVVPTLSLAQIFGRKAWDPSKKPAGIPKRKPRSR